jgi:hypothetical protein
VMTNKLMYIKYPCRKYKVCDFSNFISSMNKHGLLVSYFKVFQGFLRILKLNINILRLKYHSIRYRLNVQRLAIFKKNQLLKYYKKRRFLANAFQKRLLFSRHVLYTFKNILKRIDLKCKTILFYKSGKKYILPFACTIKQRRSSSFRLLLAHLPIRTEVGIVLKLNAEIMDLIFYRGVTFKPFYDFEKIVKEGSKLLYFLKNRKKLKRKKFFTKKRNYKPWFRFIKRKFSMTYRNINFLSVQL